MGRVRTCARPTRALTPLHAVQGMPPAACMRTRYAADFTDPGCRPALAAPADLTPAATTCDLAAGTVRGGCHIPGARAAKYQQHLALQLRSVMRAGNAALQVCLTS